MIHIIVFNSTYGGEVPEGVYWNTSLSVPGTYVFKLLDSNNSIVVEGVFGLIQINKSTFLPGESLVVAGGGAEPNSTVTIIVVSRGSSIFNGSVNADQYGEYQMILPLPTNTTDGEYSILIYIGESDAGPVFSFTIFIDTRLDNVINGTATEIMELINTVSKLNTTLQQSILAKLETALNKIEQAEHHLLLNQTRVARNMLNAARNILNACINEVSAQTGKHLDNETASNLKSSIQQIINEIEAEKLNLDRTSNKHGHGNNASPPIDKDQENSLKNHNGRENSNNDNNKKNDGKREYGKNEERGKEKRKP